MEYLLPEGPFHSPENESNHLLIGSYGCSTYYYKRVIMNMVRFVSGFLPDTPNPLFEHTACFNGTSASPNDLRRFDISLTTSHTVTINLLLNLSSVGLVQNWVCIMLI